MKKLTLFAVSCGLLMGACNKVVEAPENEKSIEMNNQQTPLQSSLSLLSKDEMLMRIYEFEKELEAADKNNGYTKIDDAGFLIEGSLNKNNGKSSINFHYASKFTYTFTLSAEKKGVNWKIRNNILDALYLDIEKKCKEYCDDVILQNGNGHIVAIDIEIYDDNQCDMNTQNICEFKVKATPIIGVTDPNVAGSCGFNATDYWDAVYDATGNGKCNGFVSNVAHGADKELEARLNGTFTGCPRNACGYFINVTNLHLNNEMFNNQNHIWPNDPTGFGDGICDYYFVNAHLLLSSTLCVSPFEMECLTQSIEELAQISTNYQSQLDGINYDIISYKLIHEYSIIYSGAVASYHHFAIGTCIDNTK